MRKALRIFKKFVKWVLYGKGVGSYIAFVVFAYVLLKFVAFPVFLYVFGLNDFIAVLSNSMHHQPGVVNITFYEWLDRNGYNKSDYLSWPFQNGLDMGDAITVRSGEINVGDVVVYYYGRNLIVHRVINKTVIDGKTYYTTKGDANPVSLDFEYNIPSDRIIGKADLKIPYLGWPRTIMYYLTGF